MLGGEGKTHRRDENSYRETGQTSPTTNRSQGSLFDFNRCGVPLIEIVSEPDMRSSAEAKAYLDTIKSILQYINISDCKMQEGSIRCDVNVSVRKKGATEFGTRCEMKNVNSFSAAVHAIDYEAARQTEVIENGGKIVQETRRWDEIKGRNFLLRSKEDAQDYRYFPEPDLLTIAIAPERVKELKDTLPELPNVKLRRFVKELGLSQTDASLIVENMDKCTLFEACLSLKKCTAKNISNWILADVSKYMNDTGKSISDTGKSISDTKMTAEKLTAIIEKIEKNEISNSGGKTVFEILLTSDMSVDEVIAEKGLAQVSDTGEIKRIVDEVMAANEKSVTDYKNGKTNALGFLVGQCMKASKGKANPAMCKELVLEYLNK